MESVKGPLKVYLGEFTVVDTSPGRITINVGKQVHITIHLGVDHDVKAGQTLPLFTEIGYAYVRPSSVQ